MNYDFPTPGNDVEADELIKFYTHKSYDVRYGPRHSKIVVDLFKTVCRTYLLDPKTVADRWAIDFNDDVHSNQVVLMKEPCPEFNKDFDHKRSRPNSECIGKSHAHRWNRSNFHYTILVFETESAVEVCRKLRTYFAPINSGSTASAGGIVLPDLGNLEERVGLKKFMEEGI